MHVAAGGPDFLWHRHDPDLSRLLLHRVDEARREDVDLVDGALQVLVHQDLDGTDEAVEPRAIAELHDARHYVAAQSVEEPEALVADRDEIDFDTCSAPFLEARRHQPQHVRVEPAAQALVRRDDNDTHALHRVALDEERMLVLGVRLRDVHRDVEDTLDVGPRGAHAVLRTLHLRSGDHLHRLRDLARALHALDLVPYFF